MLGGTLLARIIGGGVFAYRQLVYRHRGITGYWRGAMTVPATLAGIRATFFVKRSTQHGAGRLGSGRFGRSGVWAAYRRHIRAFFTGDRFS